MLFQDVVESIDGLRSEQLSLWIEQGWVRPAGSGREALFSAADAARVRLIAECRFELDIDADAMPVVLSLLDQVHGLRRELAALGKAVAAQPDAVHAEIVETAMRFMREE